MKGMIFSLIKMIPMFTLLFGAFKGRDRLGPLTDLIKVAVTQYDVGKIAGEVIKNYNETRGELVSNDELGEFVQERYYSNYSSIMRRMFSQDPDDLSLDIWGHPIKIGVSRGNTKVTVYSGGPDQVFQTKDDVKIAFPISKGKRKRKKSRTVRSYDDEGFDQNGYDRDGFDREGYNKEGFNADGYDREGYDQDGYNADGYTRDEEQFND